MFEKTAGTKGILNPWRGASSFTHPQGAHMISHHVALETRHIRMGHKSLMAKFWAQTELPYKPNRHCLFSQEQTFSTSLCRIFATRNWLLFLPKDDFCRIHRSQESQLSKHLFKTSIWTLNLTRVELNTKKAFAGLTDLGTADATMFSQSGCFYACVKHMRQCQ